jgi:hypothetical protein
MHCAKIKGISKFFTVMHKDFSNVCSIASGYCTMESVKISEPTSSLLLLRDRTYFVCAEEICSQADEIYFSGRTLLAGTSIDLTAKKVILAGTEDNSVQIVGTAFHLTTEVLKIKNVTFYIFDQMNFSLTTLVRSEIENVRLVKLELAEKTNVYTEHQIAHWKNKQDLESFILEISHNDLSESIKITLETEPSEEKVALSTALSGETVILLNEGSTPPKRTDFWKFLALGAIALFYLFSQLYLGYLRHKRINKMGGRFI